MWMVNVVVIKVYGFRVGKVLIIGLGKVVGLMVGWGIIVVVKVGVVGVVVGVFFEVIWGVDFFKFIDFGILGEGVVGGIVGVGIVFLVLWIFRKGVNWILVVWSIFFGDFVMSVVVNVIKFVE